MHCKLKDIEKTIQLINKDLLKLYKWSTKHGLKINPKKSNAIVFSPRNIPFEVLPSILIDNVVVPYCNKVKNLGVILDSSLNWSNHVSFVCQKVYFALHRLYKFRANTPIATRIRLVSSLILPIFDYGAISYCNLDSYSIDRLQVAQNNCIRYIFNLKRRDRVSSYYTKLGWLKIRERHELQALIYCHKILHGCAPPYLSNMLTLMGEVRERPSRAHSFYLQAPLVGKDAPEKSFTVLSYRYWNSLKPDICKKNNITAFRTNVEKLLLQRYLCAKL